MQLDPAAHYTVSQVCADAMITMGGGEQMTQECSVEGPYSHQQWVYIHLRHAELHLSFLTVEGVERAT